MKKKNKGRYTKEFKTHAVKLVADGGVSIRSVAKQLSVPKSTLSGWMKKFYGVRASGENSLPQTCSSERAELEQLRQELASVKAERDQLKKAVPETELPRPGQKEEAHLALTDNGPGAYDESLLDRARQQWKVGDWDSLKKMGSDTLHHHPDRGKLALLVAAGCQQQSDLLAVSQWIRLAQEWGCEKKLISKVLIAGVYNILGRAAATNNQEERALNYFQVSAALEGRNSTASGTGRVSFDRELKRLCWNKSPGAAYTSSHPRDNDVDVSGVVNDVQASVAEKTQGAERNIYVHNRIMSDALNNSLREFLGQALGKEGLKAGHIEYLAAKAIEIEKTCVGRLATTVQDAVVRQVVAECVKGPQLGILEIGSLFGVSLAILYNHCAVRFESVKVLGLDPFDGYYGKATDALLNTPISPQTFLRNMQLANVPAESFSLIRQYSTDPAALEAAGQHRINLLIIDGDHSYKGVKFDYENYLSLLDPGGYVIFDDYNAKEWPDVKNFVDQVVRNDSRVEFIGVFSRTAVGRKKELP